jgi:hypothetical protein
MSKDKGNVFHGTEISQPVPGKHTFGADHDILAVWLDSLEKDIRFSPDIAVQKGIPVLIENAEIHFVGMEIDSAVKCMLFSIKSHEKASLELR